MHYRFDLVVFDGASNVQKAGRILSIVFPRVTCIHGAEHVLSLFFDDIFKLPELDMLASFYSSLRNRFGSVRHSPAAMFKKYSKSHSNGVALNFYQDVRYAHGG